jgi:hypothetical protein
MTLSEYWNNDDQAWIMPVLAELSDEGVAGQGSDWTVVRGEIVTRLADQGAGSMTENLIQPLGDAAFPGADIAALISGLVAEYQTALSAGDGGSAATTVTAVSRFVSVGPVDGRPGWWQGYDNDDQTWKYVAATDTPSDQTTGWTPAEQMDWSAVAGNASPEPATATTVTAVSRFVSVGPVDGRPGWWQGYDNDDQTWKYVAATDTPSDQTTGWTPAEQMDWAAVDRRMSAEPGTQAAPDDGGEAAREQARANIEALLKSNPALGEGLDIEAIVNAVAAQA